MRDLRISGGTVLLANDGLVKTDVVVADGLIDRVGSGSGGQSFDASELLVMPGIVDLHGDAFERQLQLGRGWIFHLIWRCGIRVSVARERDHHGVSWGDVVVGTGGCGV